MVDFPAIYNSIFRIVPKHKKSENVKEFGADDSNET